MERNWRKIKIFCIFCLEFKKKFKKMNIFNTENTGLNTKEINNGDIISILRTVFLFEKINNFTI